MTLLLWAIALLCVGNLIVWRGSLRWTGQPYRSPQYDRGTRIVCGGTAISIVGGVFLVAWLIDIAF